MLMINITMLMITFVNSTISKSTSPVITLDSDAIEIYRQYSKDDGAHVSLVHKVYREK